jgi:GxxExxY protein
LPWAKEGPVSTFFYHRESAIIVKCSQKVQRILGNCLTKEVYMDALELEFSSEGLETQRDAPLSVWYGEEEGRKVRLPHDYYADFVVNGKVLVMVKAAGDTGTVNDYELMNLLRAAELRLLMLVQFKDKKVQINRVCRFDRYSNSLNFRRSDWFKVGDGAGEEGKQDVEVLTAER